MYFVSFKINSSDYIKKLFYFKFTLLIHEKSSYIYIQSVEDL